MEQRDPGPAVQSEGVAKEEPPDGGGINVVPNLESADDRSVETATNEAEQVRRLAEEARESRDRHREALEASRQERERLRETAETARSAGEEARRASEDARVVADAARDAVVDAIRGTADAMNISLEHMKVVEDMRRTLREITDVKKLDPN